MSTQTPNGLDPFEGPFEWTDLDQRAVDTARAAGRRRRAEGRQRPPGTASEPGPGRVHPLPEGHAHDPADAEWTGRDRFVLSPGHTSPSPSTRSSSWLGYELELDDLKAFRTQGSKTPATEYGHTAGVGPPRPARQGVANAVGMAMAARYERGLFDPEAPRDASPFDHTIVTRSSPTATWRRASPRRPAPRSPGTRSSATSSSLCDDSHISIEGDTATALLRGRPRSATRRTAGTCSAHRAAGRRQRRRTRPCTSAIAAAKKPRPGARPSSRCARSSPGPRRPPRTPRRRTARRSAPTRSPPPSASLGFDPEQSFDRRDDVISAHPQGPRPRRRGARGRVGQARSAPGAPTTSALPSCSTGSYAGRLPSRLGASAARLRDRRQASPPAPRPARSSRPSAP